MKQESTAALREMALFLLILAGLLPAAFVLLTLLPTSPPLVRGALLGAYFFAAILIWGWRERSRRLR